MSSDSYTEHLTVEASAHHVYAALTTGPGLRAWWTTDAHVVPGGTITVRFGESYKVFHVEQLVPDKLVKWKCIESHIAGELEKKDEWTGTMLTWTLTQQGSSTKLAFTHEGLTPQLECYELCASGWENFLLSLELYLETGHGMPFGAAVH